jgi:N4-(beta-N-acetylglucosaminyl)-L-asparaginase
MKSELSRRDFVRLGTLGAATALTNHPGALAQETKAVRRPVILCSRGEVWGHKVLDPAWQTWLERRQMLDAVEKGANVVELDPEDQSVGYGGLPNEEGVVELDACVMAGPFHQCGAVAGLQKIKTPSSVARLVMERTDHILLVGEGAKKFALAFGFREENLLTEKSRLAWLKWKASLSKEDDWFEPGEKKIYRPTGTINVLGLDDQGDLFGITTTSGLAFKIPGRVGDSPIIGAGLYLDNEIGAAGATGRGEEVIRTCGSFYAVSKMAQGLSPQAACEAACRRIIEVNRSKADFNVKFIAVNKAGEIGCAQLKGAVGTHVSCISRDGFQALQGAIQLVK